MPSSPVLESSPKLQISAPPLGQSGKGITYSHSPYKLNASLSGSYAETGTRRVSEQGSPLISVGSLGGRATPDVTDARGSHPGSLPIQVRPHDGDSMPNVQARYSRRGGGSPCLPSSLTQRQHVNPSAMSAFPTSPVGGGPVPQPSSVEEGSLYGSYHQQHTYPQSCPPQRRMQQSTPYGYAENALTNNNQASPFLMTPPAHSSPPVSVDSSALRHSKPRNGSTPMSSPYNSYQGNSQLAQHHTNSATYAPPNFVLPDGSSTMAAQNSSTNGYRSTSAPGESHLLHSSSSGTYAPRNSQINMRSAPPVPGNNNSTYHGAPAAAHPAEPQNFDSHTTNSHHVTGGTHSALSSLRLTAPGAAARSQALDVSCSSPSEKSSSSRSSFRDELPLCPSDGSCANINDRKHQRKFAHTCRLFPCYHGHVKRHAHLFRHVAGQISQPESGSPANISATALTSVNFSTISPEAPNAYRIYVSRGDQSYEIFGGWASVKVHTFKRYLHQVYHLAPPKQVLIVSATGRVMEDDIRTVQSYGVEEGCVIDLRSTLEERVDIPIEDL